MTKKPDADATISLSDMTRALRAELDKMRTNLEESGTAPLLFLEQAEVELTFVAERAKTKSGGFDLKVVTLGGEIANSDAVTQKLKLVMKPKQGTREDDDDTGVGIAGSDDGIPAVE